MHPTPAQETGGDAPLDISWGRIRESLAALLSNLKKLQTQLDDKDIKIIPIARELA